MSVTGYRYTAVVMFHKHEVHVRQETSTNWAEWCCQLFLKSWVCLLLYNKKMYLKHIHTYALN